MSKSFKIAKNTGSLVALVKEIKYLLLARNLIPCSIPHCLNCCDTVQTQSGKADQSAYTDLCSPERVVALHDSSVSLATWV